MKKVLFFFLVIILYSGCKKYPDGPAISLLSKEGRLTGEWDVEYFSINGYDSTSYLKSLPFYGKYFLSNEKEGKNNLFVYKNSVLPTTPNYNGGGFWMFLNHKESVYIHFNSYTPPSLGAFRAEDVVWEIRKLKSKELWLKTTYNGKEYFIKFKN